MPTIALTCILKDEIHNLKRFCESVAGCFDEVHFTDTGSTDGSVEWIKEHAKNIVGCPVFLHHFPWIKDFSAARNHALTAINTDYWGWL